MQVFFAKLTAWLLPILLDFIISRASSAVQKYQKKINTDADRGKVNEKNIAKLETCADVHSCVLAARDAFNGTDSSDSVVRPGAKVPE
jgi:hypothetical protein